MAPCAAHFHAGIGVHVGFMPGNRGLWLVLGDGAFGMAAINHVMGLKSFLTRTGVDQTSSLFARYRRDDWRLRGGLGSRVLGGSGYGGRGYIYILGAILGYFALTAQRSRQAKRAKQSTGSSFQV